MKVPFKWLRELVELNISDQKLVDLLPLRTIGTKEVTQDFVELDMKGYNRADLLSIRGVAQEVAAITDSSLGFDDTKYPPERWEGEKLPKTAVTVEAKQLTPLYCIARIEGVKVEPTNQDWKDKIETSGMRSINSIADVTNLIMLEYGQPLHAFDADQVKDNRIVVRTATTGEKLTTLDGKLRELKNTDLVIADPEKALGLAGVMGGKDSEVSDSTTTILLEAAIFDPQTLRKTSQRLGVSSEASKRFKHGLTRTRLLQALDAAIRIYEGLGGKLTALTIVGDNKDPEKSVQLSLDKVNSLIGVNLTEKEVEGYLTRLGFQLLNQDAGWKVFVPFWRLDIESEEDLVEEVARLYGYEKIPAKELTGEIPARIDQSHFKMVNKLKEGFINAGFSEVQSYSFYTVKTLEALGWNNPKDKEDLVKVLNPMSSETEYLRDMIWPNLAEVTDKNIRQGFEDVAIFEIGKVFKKNGRPAKESNVLAATLVNGSDNPLLELIQLAKQVFADNPKIRIVAEKFEHIEGLPAGRQGVDFFHPNRTASIYYQGQEVGGIAEIHQRTTDKFGISQRLAALELNLDLLQ